jgi:hypothetical protein
VNIKIAGKWMFIPLKMVFIGIDPYPFVVSYPSSSIIVKADWGNMGEHGQGNRGLIQYSGTERCC